MRLPRLWLAQCLLATPAYSKSSGKKHSTPADVAFHSNVAKADVDADEPAEETIFNGQQVPPMLELNGEKARDTLAHGNWIVEAFSPYCGHCMSLAPKWQTLYEYYYTSEPVPGTSLSASPDAAQMSLNSFSRYYNFRFAKLDCVAFMDACVDLGVGMFPTLVLLKDGEELKKKSGDKELDELSAFIEEGLEIIRPGSRQKDGVELPEVGAAQTKDFNDRRIAKEAAKSPAQPTKATVLPNLNGTSFPLTSGTYDEKITKTLDPWFVKFYAPWCHHCQAMAPAWETMAHDMEGRLNIGEVNCDIQKSLCRSNKIKSYPTIKLLRGPEAADYNGLRGVGDLLDFANKAATIVTGVVDVTLAEFETLEAANDVVFVYFYDDATTSEDFAAMERLPLQIMGHGPMVKTRDLALARRFQISTFPRLLSARPGAPAVYPKLMPQEVRDVSALLEWLTDHWLPLVPELGAANAREVMHKHFAVLGVLSHDRKETFASAKAELHAAAATWTEGETGAYNAERQRRRDAKQSKIAAAERGGQPENIRDAKQLRVDMMRWDKKRTLVRFAWVDSVFWERWLKTTFGVSGADGETIIIYDVDNHRYWDTTTSGTPIPPTASAILDTLAALIKSPSSIRAKTTDGAIAHAFFAVWRSFFTQPLTSGSIAIVVVVGVLVAVSRWRARRRRDGYAHINGRDGILGSGVGNGKSD